MKRFKVIALVCLVFFLALPVFVMTGCTGAGAGGRPTTTVTPTFTPTSGGPTTTPSRIMTPVGRGDVQTIVSGTNVFNIAVWGNSLFEPFVNVTFSASLFRYLWSEDIYWVESTGLPLGRVLARTFSRRTGQPLAQTKTIATGYNNPMAFLLHRNLSDPSAPLDYIFTSEQRDPAGGAIYRLTRNDAGNIIDTVTVVTGLQGRIPYMTFDKKHSDPTYIYYSRVTAGLSSVVERVQVFPTTGALNFPVVPQRLISNLTNPHHVYAFDHFIPAGAKDPVTHQAISILPNANNFIFVTEQLEQPNGRVLMFNVSNWNGESQLVPTVLATGIDTPSKLTFIPDVEIYDVTSGGLTTQVAAHSRKPAGYLYWTNFDSVAGRVMRVRLQTNAQNNNLVVAGDPQVVAQSLNNSYDLIGPDDYRYVYLTLSSFGILPASVISNPVVTLNHADYYASWLLYQAAGSDLFDLLYVSRNLDTGNGGNWYEINSALYNGVTPLVPNGPGVNTYLTSNTSFPFNGVMQMYMVVGGTSATEVGKAFKKDLYYCGYDFSSSGNQNGYINIMQNNFDLQF